MVQLSEFVNDALISSLIPGTHRIVWTSYGHSWGGDPANGRAIEDAVIKSLELQAMNLKTDLTPLEARVFQLELMYKRRHRPGTLTEAQKHGQAINDVANALHMSVHEVKDILAGVDLVQQWREAIGLPSLALRVQQTRADKIVEFPKAQRKYWKRAA